MTRKTIEPPGAELKLGNAMISETALRCSGVALGLAALLASIAWASGGLPEVTPVGCYSQLLRAPARVAADAAGTCYVADSSAGRIVRIDAFGRAAVVQRLDRPLGVAVGADGKIYVGEEKTGSVSVFDSQWRMQYRLGRGDHEFALPNFIAPDPAPGSDLVFVSDSYSHQVKAYRGGSFSFSFGGLGSDAGKFDFPAGIWVSSNGEVVVVDQGNDRLQVFDRAGRFLRRVSLLSSVGPGLVFSGGRSLGVTGDASGRLYVADTFQDLIRVFSAQGTHLGNIGGFGEAAGQLRSPAGVVIDLMNRLLVASPNNSRVEIFGLDSFLHPTASPAFQVVAAGSEVRFSAVMGGAGPFGYQWRKGGQDLADSPTLSGSRSSTLVLASVGPADSGGYSVVVTGAGAVVTSPSAELTVLLPPSILAPPVSQTVAVGGNAFFAISATGDTLSYQWQHDGATIPGATTSTLLLERVGSFEGGSYSACVSNEVGSNTATARLTVQIPPSIVLQPAPCVVVQEGTAAFEVVAEGDSLAYQWFFNGQSLPGRTTTTLAVEHTQTEQAGSYSVVVQNSVGAVTSASAALAVLVPPSQMPDVASASFAPDNQLQLVVNGPPGYRFAIEASEDLQRWITLTRFESDGAVFRFGDVHAPNFPQRFYRVRWAPLLTP